MGSNTRNYHITFDCLQLLQFIILTFTFCYSHAHPGSPYVFGLAEVDHDLEFPDPMPVVGMLYFQISIPQILVKYIVVLSSPL
jgi:hypothetical protein